MPTDVQAILKLEVPVIVQVASRTMEMEDVLALAPGVIIELPKTADEELDILVNNKVVGTGSAVKVGENFGVRVQYIGDLRRRLEAMGPAVEAAAVEGDAPAGEDESVGDEVPAEGGTEAEASTEVAAEP